jgi:hypothetical protein
MSDRSASLLVRVVSSILTLLTVLALTATIWTTIALRPWQATRVRAAHPSPQVPWTAVNPIGVNTFLAREVEIWKRERTVEMVADMGAGWIKEHVAWSEIEPEDDVYWDAKYQQDSWAKYDQIVSLAEQHGLRVIARIDQTPAWARPQAMNAAAPPVNVEKFGDFIEEFVRHFHGRVSFLQIWNEPNLASEWGGRIDPAGYVALLAEAARRARSVDPNIVILSAPMAMTTENSARAMDELRYWQALYDLGVAQHFDIVSANAYGLDEPYDDPADPQKLNVRRIELLHDLMAEHGDGDKAVWLNEYGWNASPADFPEDELIWARVSDAEQANWTADGLAYARSAWPWFGVASIWYFRQVGDISATRSEYYFRMVDLEFTPRDVYWSVQALGEQLSIGRVGHYGALEAPITAYGGWNLRHNGAEHAVPVIHGNDRDRLLIRVDGNQLTLRLGPEQTAGSLEVEVFSGAEPEGHTQRWELAIEPGQPEVSVKVATGTEAQATRAVQLTVTEGSELAVSGIEIRYQRSYQYLLIALSVLIFAAFGRVLLTQRAAA